MSDYRITPDELDTLTKNARETMGGLFACASVELTYEECVQIYRRSYK